MSDDCTSDPDRIGDHICGHICGQCVCDECVCGVGRIADQYRQIRMEIAAEASLQNVLNHTGGPFGAAIVDTHTQTVIAVSSNSVTVDNDPTAHAEINTIRAACKKLKTFNLSGHSLYTSCEPCPMCFGAIYWARLDHVYYANTKSDAAKIDFDDSLIYDELEKPIKDRKIKFTHLPNRTAQQAFELWEAGDDKVKY